MTRREGAVARLRAAAELAAAHGSVALVRRCEDELRTSGVPSPGTGFGDR